MGEVLVRSSPLEDTLGVPCFISERYPWHPLAARLFIAFSSEDFTGCLVGDHPSSEGRSHHPIVGWPVGRHPGQSTAADHQAACQRRKFLSPHRSHVGHGVVFCSAFRSWRTISSRKRCRVSQSSVTVAVPCWSLQGTLRKAATIFWLSSVESTNCNCPRIPSVQFVSATAK